MFLGRACHSVSSALIMKCTPGTATTTCTDVHGRSPRVGLCSIFIIFLHQQQLCKIAAMRSYDSFRLKPNTHTHTERAYRTCPSGTRSTLNLHEASTQGLGFPSLDRVSKEAYPPY